MIKLGALWVSKTKEGEKILSGQINQDTRIVILKNGFKKEDGQPDFYLYAQPNERKSKGSKAPAREAQEEDAPF